MEIANSPGISNASKDSLLRQKEAMKLFYTQPNKIKYSFKHKLEFSSGKLLF